MKEEIEQEATQTDFVSKTITLISCIEMIKKIARGAILTERADDADYFCSVKYKGEEFNVYVFETKIR